MYKEHRTINEKLTTKDEGRTTINERRQLRTSPQPLREFEAGAPKRDIAGLLNFTCKRKNQQDPLPNGDPHLRLPAFCRWGGRVVEKDDWNNVSNAKLGVNPSVTPFLQKTVISTRRWV